MISTRPVTAEVVPSTWQNGGPILVAGDNWDDLDATMISSTA